MARGAQGSLLSAESAAVLDSRGIRLILLILFIIMTRSCCSSTRGIRIILRHFLCYSHRDTRLPRLPTRQKRIGLLLFLLTLQDQQVLPVMPQCTLFNFHAGIRWCNCHISSLVSAISLTFQRIVGASGISSLPSLVAVVSAAHALETTAQLLLWQLQMSSMTYLLV